MADIEIEGYYQRQAKELTELLHDKRFLNDDLTLQSIEWLQDYLGFVIQSQCQSAAKCAQLTAKMRERKQ